MELSYQHIIAAFKKGDEKATQQLFNSFFKPLCYFNEQIIGNQQLAEDIATESFIKLIDRKNDFFGIAPMRSFLFVVSKNACVDFLRQNKKIVALGDHLKGVVNWDDSFIEREMIIAKVLQIIYAEIEMLPHQCRHVFRSIFIEGKTTHDIAKEMKISPQTVLNQKSKALKLLRIELAKQGYDAGDLLFYCLSLMSLTDIG
jgi:RNA polymerase sigma-70 factor (ECF subfamily)